MKIVCQVKSVVMQFVINLEIMKPSAMNWIGWFFLRLNIACNFVILILLELTILFLMKLMMFRMEELGLQLLRNVTLRDVLKSKMIMWEI